VRENCFLNHWSEVAVDKHIVINDTTQPYLNSDHFGSLSSSKYYFQKIFMKATKLLHQLPKYISG